MASTQRLRTVAVAAAIVLMPPAAGLARTLEVLTPTPTAPLATVIVRTVSAPGGMSPTMKTALRSVGSLFAPAAQRVEVLHRPDGTMVLTSPSRFLNVVVGGAGADGEPRTRCVSSRDEALRAMVAGHAPAAEAEKE